MPYPLVPWFPRSADGLPFLDGLPAVRNAFASALWEVRSCTVDVYRREAGADGTWQFQFVQTVTDAVCRAPASTSGLHGLRFDPASLEACLPPLAALAGLAVYAGHRSLRSLTPDDFLLMPHHAGDMAGRIAYAQTIVEHYAGHASLKPLAGDLAAHVFDIVADSPAGEGLAWRLGVRFASRLGFDVPLVALTLSWPRTRDSLDWRGNLVRPVVPETVLHPADFDVLRRAFAASPEDDTSGFTAHPVDVALYASETCRALDKATARAGLAPQSVREPGDGVALADSEAQRWLRAHVTCLIAQAVAINDANARDWAASAAGAVKSALTRAAREEDAPLTCGVLIDRLAQQLRDEVDVTRRWQWGDGTPLPGVSNRIPHATAAWLIRVCLAATFETLRQGHCVAGKVRDALRDEAMQAQQIPIEAIALARNDTPADLEVGTHDWRRLLTGIRQHRRDHWSMTFDAVCDAGLG